MEPAFRLFWGLHSSSLSLVKSKKNSVILEILLMREYCALLAHDLDEAVQNDGIKSRIENLLASTSFLR
jgi:hypothetical protein